MGKYLVSLHKAYIALYAVVSILHFLGLLLLCIAKIALPHQRLLTKNLAVVELLFCLNMVISYCTAINTNNNLVIQSLYTFFAALLFTEIRLTMLHIIFDRFLEIYVNIKYPLYMTRTKVLSVMASTWISSMVCATLGLLFKLLRTFDGKWRFQIFFCFALDIVILISAMTTQVYFFITVRKIRGLEVEVTGQPRESRVRLLIKKFKLPCYIVFTYIFFNLTSTIILAFIVYEDNKNKVALLINFSQSLVIVGVASDAFIYVYATGNVRKLLKSMFRRRNLQVSSVNDDTTYWAFMYLWIRMVKNETRKGKNEMDKFLNSQNIIPSVPGHFQVILEVRNKTSCRFCTACISNVSSYLSVYQL